MWSMLSRWFHSGLPHSGVIRLSGVVNSYNNESRCRSAMEAVLRALDYDPTSEDVLRLAQVAAWGCMGAHHRCREPLGPAEINDPRLDAFFNDCAACSRQWIPSPSVLSMGFIEGIALVNPPGGYCSTCKKGWCADHWANPGPTDELATIPCCPECGGTLDCRRAFGRKPRQTLRRNRRLRQVILLRQGPLPPDREYCLKVFRLTSRDVLEDSPNVVGMALDPWEDRAEHVLGWVAHWLKERSRQHITDDIAIWSAMDNEARNRFYQVKVWGPSPRVTKKNLFDAPEVSEAFPFETASLSRPASPEHVVAARKSSGKIEKEFVDLFESFVIEAVARSGGRGEIDPAPIVRRASNVLMRKYDISEQEMVEVVKRAITSMSLDRKL